MSCTALNSFGLLFRNTLQKMLNLSLVSYSSLHSPVLLCLCSVSVRRVPKTFDNSSGFDRNSMIHIWKLLERIRYFVSLPVFWFWNDPQQPSCGSVKWCLHHQNVPQKCITENWDLLFLCDSCCWCCCYSITVSLILNHSSCENCQFTMWYSRLVGISVVGFLQPCLLLGSQKPLALQTPFRRVTSQPVTWRTEQKQIVTL